MRNALPLLIAGTCLAFLPLLGPAASPAPVGLERSRACLSRETTPITTVRDWMGSLHGWQDSSLVLIWRASLAVAKGKPGRSACQD